MDSSEIAEIANVAGLNLVRIVTADSLKSGSHAALQRLSQWQQQGYAAQMQYMNRPGEIFFDLDQFLPGIKSIVSVSVRYSNVSIGPTPRGYGRVARYAWGRDYHKILKKRIEYFSSLIKKRFPNTNTRTFTDAVPLLERHIAASSGVGFIGKNTMHILPGIGSFTLLGEVLLDADINADNALAKSEKASCKTCTSCLDNCPTSAFVAPYVLDANRCISYLTIEYKGSFSQWQRSAVGEWLFGCDICQEVCPFNHRGLDDVVDDELAPENGNGPFLSLKSILEIEDRQQFLTRFAGTPLMRAGYKGLIRNCCAVVANSRDTTLISQLLRLISNEEVVIRSSAIDALECLEEDLSSKQRQILKETKEVNTK